MKSARKAVAMIELIFSIVVMGIAMLAIPMITSQTIKGSQSAMMQESVSEVASNINLIMSKPWDSAYNQLVDPASETTILSSESGNFVNRRGLNMLPSPLNSGVRDTIAQKATSATISGADDISDYDGVATRVAVYQNQANPTYSGDYADTTVTMGTVVKYYPDNIVLGSATTFNFDPAATVGGTTNIKRVTITLTSTAIPEKNNIKLNGFSCNIGSSVAATREQL